jgi:multicomponent Na+:H+ antiporter subunit G
VGLIIVAVAVHFGDVGVATRALLVGAFFLLTAPVGAHMIGRAAYLTGTPLWKGTVVDEWRGAGAPRPTEPSGPSGSDAPPVC